MEKRGNNSIFFGYFFLIFVSAVYSFINTDLEIKGTLSTVIVAFEILIFIAFVVVNGRYNKNTIAIISLLLIIAVGTYITTKETVFIVMLMVAIVCSRLDYKKIFKLLLTERTVILFLIVLMSLIGILPVNETSIIKGGTSTAVIGYGLGFDHPNQLAYNISLIMMLLICYRNSKLRQRDILFIVFITIVGYLITRSRTLLVLGVISFLGAEFYLFTVKNNKNPKLEGIWKLSIWIMPICAIAALGLPLMMSTATGQFKIILYAINGIIGSRFTHSARVFDLYPVTLFGGRTEFELLNTNFGYSVVDNGYLCLLYNFGVVGFFIFIVLFFFAIKKLIEKKQYVFLIAIMSISLLGVTENILRSFAINFSVIFWSECLDYLSAKQYGKHRIRLKLK